jgi:hypothetical protein
VLIADFAITVRCLLINVGLVIFGRSTPETAQLEDSTSKGFILGFGALIGLLGGKTLP